MKHTYPAKKRTIHPVVTAVICILAVIGISIVIVSNDTEPITPLKDVVVRAASTTNPYQILPPAQVPSKTAECVEPITYDSNGNSGPITCASGDLNITEWNALAALEPSVLSLGYSASFAAVQTAICNDAGDSNSDANTNNAVIVEQTTYKIAALYYGWHFTSDPTAVLSSGSC